MTTDFLLNFKRSKQFILTLHKATHLLSENGERIALAADRIDEDQQTFGSMRKPIQEIPVDRVHPHFAGLVEE